jgi:hypothetical protein
VSDPSRPPSCDHPNNLCMSLFLGGGDFTTFLLSGLYSIKCRMTDELERIWKEAVVA